jgi:DnaK suppressor protein
MNQEVSERLAQFRATLMGIQSEARVVMGRSRRAVAGQAGEKHVGDLVDAVQGSIDLDVTAAQCEAAHRRLRRAAAALEALDGGTYGKCADCGGDIPTKRLLAQPLADRCIPCQETVETRV